MVLTQSCSDDELLAAGGPDGFAVFYRRHVQAILRYHARWARDAEVAADLTAETFAAALEAKHRFSPGGPPARAWLFGIAVKKLADYRRRGYAEDRARRRLGMERVEPTDADLRWIESLVDDVEVTELVDELPAGPAPGGDGPGGGRARVRGDSRRASDFDSRRAQAGEPGPGRAEGTGEGEPMTDFVTRLEAELHDAAVQRERSGRMRGVALPRLRVALGGLPAAALATVLLALAVAAAAMILAASPERSVDTGMPATLRGVWQAPPKELRLYPRGSERCANLGVGSSAACYTLGSSANGVGSEWGRLSVDGDELTLTGTQNSTPGVYRWRIERDTLRLTKLHDPVSARARALVATPLRPVHPAYARANLPIGWTSHPFTSRRFGYSLAAALRSGWPIRVAQPTDSLATRIAAPSPPSRSWRGHCRPARRPLDGRRSGTASSNRPDARLTTSGASTSRASR